MEFRVGLILVGAGLLVEVVSLRLSPERILGLGYWVGCLVFGVRRGFI